MLIILFGSLSDKGLLSVEIWDYLAKNSGAFLYSPVVLILKIKKEFHLKINLQHFVLLCFY